MVNSPFSHRHTPIQSLIESNRDHEQRSAPVFYRISSYDVAGHRFHISLLIMSPNPEGQRLSLPRWIPGSYMIRDFSKHIEWLQASQDDMPLPVTAIDNHQWLVTLLHDGPLLVEYCVYAWDLSVRKAHLDESHGFFNGTSVFLEVEGQSDQPCWVEIIAPKSTKKWRVYTTLPRAKNHPKGANHTRFGFYRARNYDELIDHPVEMGRPQVVSFVACGIAHDMVFTGVLPNIDLARIARDVTQICEAQIRLFEPETATPPFIDTGERYVFMTTVTGSDYGGLEHRNSTALICSRNALPTLGQDEQTAAYRDFLGLVSHEYFHSWNVKRIKPAAFSPYRLDQATPTTLLWIFEGFTSYYDDLMVYRSGLMTRQQYLDTLATTITRVANSTGRFKQSVAQSSFDAWTKFYQQDENADNQIVSYYSKGSLVALCLDLLIRQQSQRQYSLDDVMRYLWQHYGRNTYTTTEAPRGLHEDDLVTLLNQAVALDPEVAQDFLDDYVYGTQPLPLRTLLEAEGLTLHEVPPAPGEPSVSLDIRNRTVNGQCQIQRVMEFGTAHRAGLSAGDTLVAIDGLRVDGNNLPELLGRYQRGQRAVVHVFRRDELRQFKVKFRPPLQVTYGLKPSNAS